MAYKQNSPIKQAFLNTASNVVSNTSGLQNQTSNPFNSGGYSGTVLGMLKTITNNVTQQLNNARANAVKNQPKIVNNQIQTVKPQPVQPTVPPVQPTVPPVQPTVPPAQPTVPPAQPTVQAVQEPITKPNEVAPSPINPGLFSNMDTIGKLNENTTFWANRYKESF